MKKKCFANAVLVLIIIAMLAGGIWYALQLRTDTGDPLGSAFSVQPLADDRLYLSDAPAQTCTISLRCDTILQNRTALDAAKLPYVPADGVILPATEVEFTEGETVFDVLQRVCTAADIQLEYSWTPLYDSYYIEGINHLYEFDCGPQSGWMYRVNGRFPNHGCSAYELQGGEVIDWLYTCKGLGTDVGAPEGGME